jgi:hypothetical protein
MLSRSAWIVPTALTLVFSIAAGATGVTLFVGGAAACLVVTLFALWRDFKPRDKYDLQSLKEFEEKQELADLDPNVGVFEFDDYLCPYCRHIYSTEFRKCPKCGRTRSS